jgi:putative endopeptidase
MTRTLLSLAACTALALSMPALAQDTPPPPPQAPQMSFGSWGVDMTQIDPVVRPGDDFFAMVNRKWIASTPIPAERSSYGAFAMLDENAQADVRNLVEELVKANPAPGTAERRIVDSYQSYLDTAAIDAAGLAPARPWLDRIFAAKDLTQVATLFGEPGIPSPLGAFVMIDEEQPDRYTVGFAGDGLGLPDRDYYLKTDAKSREIQQKYRDYLAFLLGKAGYADPANAAKAVYNLELGFALAGWDRALSRNRDLTYNKIDRARLVSLAGGFPLEPMLEKSGLGKVGEFVAWQLPPDEAKAKKIGLSPADAAKLGGGIPAMFAQLEKAPLATVQAWMAAHFLSANADVLPSDTDQASFAFYGKLLNGQQEQRPRWKRAIDTVESQLGEMLGKAYVERHFPASSKAAMLDLVGNLKKAMGEALAGNGWMSAATKVEAQAKLEHFTTKIGYPDTFETYDGLVIQPGKPLENDIAAGDWSWRDDLAKLGGPIDRAEWQMLPQTVNAYYDSSLNEIVFPAAILQAPFFDPKADPAVNYGGIGAVIGHEIGHGFDDQGAKYDGTGLARDWWAAADLAAFTKRGDALVAQYERFCPLDEGKTCVNGRLTLGENIGDLAGLSVAYRAYRMSLGGKEAPVIDGLTGDQRFFLSWAQVWRVAMRDDALRQRLMTDPHSPAQFRVNGAVRNIDAWYKAFDIKPGDKLYLPPAQRVRIW